MTRDIHLMPKVDLKFIKFNQVKLFAIEVRQTNLFIQKKFHQT